MNIINVSVDFTKSECNVYGYTPVDNDYNVSKLVFDFDKEYEGRKVLEIRPLNSYDSNATFVSEIIDNEVILGNLVEGEYHSIFTQAGDHIVEVHLYNDNSKMTAISKINLKVKEEQIVIDDEQATVYLPIFDQMIQELDRAIDETNNLNLDISKTDNKTTVELTNKDGTTKTVDIMDGTTEFASFEINNDMELVCYTTDSMYLEFNINDNGELEVLI
jgi:hypothetical protein